ncbi:hypothetical protein [Amycolatopsis sp. La24]|uniref:hypothetical protein n=1 Tax=Amycolatopsis sp. La24 TaxID=3028304 RepID=UPI0023B0413E|nr:hypothetical protein [Amycolatopsis sp. La24]
MTVAVDLDQRRNPYAGFARRSAYRRGLRDAVQQHAHGDSPSQQRKHARELVRIDADGVRDVGVAAVGEGFCLGQRRHCDRTWLSTVHQRGRG